MTTSLRTARRGRGLSQTDLANRVSADQTTISRLEAGTVEQPGHVLVQRICRVLGIAWHRVDEFQLPEDKA